jgi:hypothetical protein
MESAIGGISENALTGLSPTYVFGFKILRYDPQCAMVEAFPITSASEI